MPFICAECQTPFQVQGRQQCTVRLTLSKGADPLGEEIDDRQIGKCVIWSQSDVASQRNKAEQGAGSSHQADILEELQLGSKAPGRAGERGGTQAGEAGSETGECWTSRATVWLSDLTLVYSGSCKVQGVPRSSFASDTKFRVPRPFSFDTNHKVGGVGGCVPRPPLGSQLTEDSQNPARAIPPRALIYCSEKDEAHGVGSSWGIQVWPRCPPPAMELCGARFSQQ